MIFLQLWEESFKDGNIIPDGCSLHIDKKSRDMYIDSIYSKRGGRIPKSYERIVGEECEVEVGDSISEIVKRDLNVRLSEIELNNLLGLKIINIVND